jgi:hypothetical protein
MLYRVERVRGSKTKYKVIRKSWRALNNYTHAYLYILNRIEYKLIMCVCCITTKQNV